MGVLARLIMVMVMVSAQASAQPGGLADPWAEAPPVLPAPLPARPAPPPPPPPEVEQAPATPPVPIPPVVPMPTPLPADAQPAPSDWVTDPAVTEPAEADETSDDETIAAGQVPVQEPVVLPRYPRSFVDRPVVLPDGVRAFSIGGRMSSQSVEDANLRFGGAGLGVGIGLEGYEVGFGADILLFQTDNLPEGTVEDSPKFQRASASIAIALPSETYIGASATLGNALSRYRRYSPDVSIGHKFEPSERGAVYVSGGVDYNYGNDLWFDGDMVVTHRIGGYAGGTARIQLTPELAVQASGLIAHFKYIDKHHTNDDSYRTLSGSGSLLISVSHTADVVMYIGKSSVDVFDIVSGGLSVTMRSPTR